MRKLRYLIILAAGVLCPIACNELPDVELTLPPAVSSLQGEAGTAMLGESVTVSVLNVKPDTRVTVFFDKEKTLTRTGAGPLSYTFASTGLKTVRVMMEPEEVATTIWRVYVEDLESFQSLAKKLRADPSLCLVMAHRANSSDFTIPENSFPAIEKCIQDKVDIVENDLYTTKDGVLVVSHDNNINRETTGSGYIKNLTLAQIKAVNLKDRNGNATTEKMLTFDEYLDACKGRIYINVDLGDRDAKIADVVNAIARKGMLQQVLVYCNTKAKIIEAFEANPECNVYSGGGQGVDLRDYGQPGWHYCIQTTWYPTTKEASANGKLPSSSPWNPTRVANAYSNYGSIVTVNAIWTSEPDWLYRDKFTQVQLQNLFETYPNCQCIHVDTGAETRAALITYGKRVRE